MSYYLECLECSAELSCELYLKLANNYTAQDMHKLLGIKRRCCLVSLYIQQPIAQLFGVQTKEEEKIEESLFVKK
jgi:hypothetical protein